MTRDQDASTESIRRASAPHGCAQPPSEHPLFKGMSPFDAAMYRVALLDLGDEGSGCTPFILATAELSLEARRDLLIQASAALLEYCDRYGAAECLRYALGLEHVEPSDELDQVIEDGLLQLSVAAALDDGGASDEATGQVEDVARFIDEVHSK